MTSSLTRSAEGLPSRSRTRGRTTRNWGHRGQMPGNTRSCPRAAWREDQTTRALCEGQDRARWRSMHCRCSQRAGVAGCPSLRRPKVRVLQGRDLRIWPTQGGYSAGKIGSSSTRLASEEQQRHWSVRHGCQKCPAQHSGSSCWQ